MADQGLSWRPFARMALTLALSILSAACSNDEPGAPEQADEPSKPPPVGSVAEESAAPEQADAPSDPPPVSRIAEDLSAGGAESVIVLVSVDGREYVATAGTRPSSEDQRWRIGTVTTMFTATMALQLVEEGKLDLDNTLEEYLPGVVPDGDEITIRDLLWHQSGLVDVADISGWGTSPSHRPVETLQFAGSMPLTSQPGTTHKYSHTNYVALGLIIEQATGRTYGQQLAQRIVDPYGFASIEMPTTPQLPDLDDTGENPLVAWAAGAIVSNTSDLARFLSALLSGQILPEDFLAEAQEAQPSSDEYHVLGLYALELPCGRYWGLDGYINVYNARVRASGDGSRVAVAIATNPASDLGPVFNSRVCW